MEDNISLDDITTQAQFDLNTLYENNVPSTEQSPSPFDLCSNNCSYYDPSHVNEVLNDDSASLSLFCLNSQGLQAHWDSFTGLMSEMSSSQGMFDVIGITELFNMTDEKCDLEGYHPLKYKTRTDTSDSRGGVGVYVKDSIDFDERKDLNIFIPNVFESIFVEMQIAKKQVIIGVVYRPNTYPYADLQLFMDTMNQIQSKLSSENKDVYIMGDMNIDFLKFNSHPKTGEYLENIFLHGFIPLISKPTRITPYSATLIDHIYTNKLNIDIKSGIIITDVSDHFGIFSVVKNKIYNHKQKRNINHTRNYCQKNVEYFNRLLQDTDFISVLEANCAELAYTNFMTLYKNAYNIAFPLKTVATPKRYIKRLPWMTSGLLQSSVRKNKLLTVKLKFPSVTNIEKYKEYTAVYNRLLRLSKNKYFHQEIESSKHDIKKTWTFLNMAMDKNKVSTPLPSKFIHDNIMISNKHEIATLFNNYFANIGLNVSESVAATDVNFSSYLRQMNPHSIFLDPIMPHDILNVCKKIKPKLSRGHDEISSKLMKQSIHNILIPITHIFNLSLSTGIVPKDMKIAKVIPLHKQGNKNIFNNYRPISILPSFSKLLEKIVAIKLLTFLEQFNQFYQHQYGFRPHHATIHPVIQLLNQIAKANDKPTKDFTMAVFLDLTKAFDTINHDILLKKLEHLGIKGRANEWFKSYLSDRKQYMDIFDVQSPLENVSCGVPQGSILGPILFLVYMNDINYSSKLFTLCFADDTTVSCSSTDLKTLYHVMNGELQHLSQWLKSNKLCLNTKKNKYIIFKPSQNHSTCNQEIYIDHQKIEKIGNSQETKSFKFLGIHIDESLTWKHHISNLCKKIAHANYIINKVKNLLPSSCLKTLYYSLVQSHLNYGIEAWGSSNAVDSLYKLQKRSIRIINRKPYNWHTEPLFKKNEILTVKDQYKLHVAKFMYKLKSDKLPKSFNNLNYFATRTYQTRQNNMATTTLGRSHFSCSLPLHKFPQIWNDLNALNFSCETQKQFLGALCKYFIENYMNNVTCNNPRCTQCATN